MTSIRPKAKVIWGVFVGLGVVLAFLLAAVQLWDYIRRPDRGIELTTLTPSWHLISKVPQSFGYGYVILDAGKGSDEIPVYLNIFFEIRGSTEDTVLVTDVGARVIECRPPARGEYVPPSGSDGAPIRWMEVDLDTNPPRVDKQPGLDPGPDQMWDFPLRVSSTNVEVFGVTGFTKRYDCDWVIQVKYLDGSRTKIAELDNNGRPWRTTSPVAATGYTPEPTGPPEVEPS